MHPSTPCEPGAPRRRRHGTVLTQAIHQAVIDLAVEGGLSSVSMEAVAARARTSKPVLYRRWPNRQALVRDAFLQLVKADVPVSDTGSYRSDMLAVLRGWAALFRGPAAPALVALVGAATHDPELGAVLREGVIGWRKEAMAELLGRGVERGDVRPDVPIDIARELGQSVLWHRFLISGDTLGDHFLQRLVDEVLVPFVTPAQPHR